LDRCCSSSLTNSFGADQQSHRFGNHWPHHVAYGGFLGQKRKEIGEQLREELGEFSGEDTVDLLAGVLDKLDLEEANLLQMEPNSRKWNDLFENTSTMKL
jgi:hypothetical protein